MIADREFLIAFDALPVGGYGGTFEGRRYRIVKSQFSCARSQKLLAEELGGTDSVAFNLYRLASGEALLKPCEMSPAKVRAFVIGVTAD